MRATLRQQATAKRLGCDVSGSQWTASEAELEAFCASAAPAARRAALVERRNVVQACIAERRAARAPAPARSEPAEEADALTPAATPDRCRTYVAATLRQQATAWQLGCEVSGERWASSAPELASRCAAARPPELRAELVAGRQAIEACASDRQEAPADAPAEAPVDAPADATTDAPTDQMDEDSGR